MEDVFSFGDFMSKNGSKKVEPIKFIDEEPTHIEETEDIEDTDVVSDDTHAFSDYFGNETIETEDDIKLENPYSDENWKSSEPVQYNNPEPVVDELESLPETYNESVFAERIEDDGEYYKLYQDKNEEFTCDIMIEGSSPDQTYARIILESENWSLVFPGEIINGKCVVPIKKLNILKEGEIGNIKLEVVAEGNLFVPWEDQFKVKLSKKVTVNLNENKKQPKKPIIHNKIGVKVNVR